MDKMLVLSETHWKAEDVKQKYRESHKTCIVSHLYEKMMLLNAAIAGASSANAEYCIFIGIHCLFNARNSK